MLECKTQESKSVLCLGFQDVLDDEWSCVSLVLIQQFVQQTDFPCLISCHFPTTSLSGLILHN
jgi:hypothetical protein